MWRSLVWTMGFLVLVPALGAQEKSKDPTAAEQLQELQKEIRDAQSEIVKKFRAAKTDEERDKLRSEYFALPAAYAPKFLALAEDKPEDPTAFVALTWVVSNVRSSDEPTAAEKAAAKAAEKAVDLLVKYHIKNEGLDRICAQLERSDTAAAEKLLRAALEKSPHETVKGTACYVLAKVIVERAGADQKRQAEAEKLFERAGKEFADVRVGRGKISDLIENDLFLLRTLGIGKVAPEIEAEDIDGVTFKLSDYRGKVVVIDFWGNW